MLHPLQKSFPTTALSRYCEYWQSTLSVCILAHHGKYEFGSPKIPAIIEALALNHADDTDAKLETFKEILENNSGNKGYRNYKTFRLEPDIALQINRPDGH